MRKRITLQLLAVAVVATALSTTPLLAGDNDQELQVQEAGSRFDAVVANQASLGSSSPQSFAPCVNGMAAGEFPCDNVDMLSFVPHGALGTTFVNDVWGWTDPQTGKDYVLVGAIEGTAFVDITDPKRPQVLGILPTQSTAGGDFWRDIKVYEDHAFIVSENTNHGMQVFDLTQLRDWDGTYTTYTATAVYRQFGRAHNLNINEDTGFAYAVGNAQGPITCSSGLHMVDIRDPANPTFAGCFASFGYIHDTQCVVYEGPDAEHRGKEICINATAQSTNPNSVHRVTITDVTDKSNPVALSSIEYPTKGYSHQGWLTPDQSVYLHGDELDEVTHGINTTTRVWDVSDLDAPELIGVHDNGTTSIDHNIYTEGRLAFASNYTSGLRVLDTREAASGELTEVGFFDVYPENDNASFEGGTWSNYTYFAQKKVVAVGSIDRGLFVLRPRGGLNNNA